MASQTINLLQTKTTFQPVLALIERYARVASIILLVVVVSGSILVGSAFFIFGQQKNILELEKQQLLTRIKENVRKESLMFIIRNRLNTVDRIMATQKSYAPFVDTTIEVIQSFPLTSFSMGEKNSVSISVTVSTLADAVYVVKKLMDMDGQKKITSPMLNSFSLESAKIQLGLSYIVVL